MSILHGNCIDRMKEMADNSVDLIATDQPYGYSFMNKEWDIDVPTVECYSEMLRVLKPGSFAFIFSSPRSDVFVKSVNNIKEAGFDISFTPIYWTYGTGMNKSMNMYKAIDKRFFHEWFKEQPEYEEYKRIKNDETISEANRYRKSFKKKWAAEIGEIIESIDYEHPNRKNRNYVTNSNVFSGDRKNDKMVARKRAFAGDHGGEWDETQIQNTISVDLPVTPQAKKARGSYGGFQPKPATECIIVAMKPLSEDTFIDQFIKNGKGVMWLDDCRIPAEYSNMGKPMGSVPNVYGYGGYSQEDLDEYKKAVKKAVGRRLSHKFSFGGGGTGFKVRVPYNRGSGLHKDHNNPENNSGWNSDDDEYKKDAFFDVDLRGRFPANLLQDFVFKNDWGKYFDLNEWYSEILPNLPFLYIPKPTKEEKDLGLNNIKEEVWDKGQENVDKPHCRGKTKRKNSHPTVKPVKLMMYLICLGSRPGDVILDPFGGSGTTLIAALFTNRIGKMCEMDEKSCEIARARYEFWKNKVDQYVNFDIAVYREAHNQRVIKNIPKEQKTLKTFMGGK